jgi:hypothetical protein
VSKHVASINAKNLVVLTVLVVVFVIRKFNGMLTLKTETEVTVLVEGQNILYLKKM